MQLLAGHPRQQAGAAELGAGLLQREQENVDGVAEVIANGIVYTPYGA
jgi:hypothetical protein